MEPKLNFPIFPPNSSHRFRNQTNLNLQQHVILDNLWANRYDPKRLIPLFHTLAKIFHQTNEEFEHTPLPPSLETPASNFP